VNRQAPIAAAAGIAAGLIVLAATAASSHPSASSFDSIYALAIQKDGKIVAAGLSYARGRSRLVVARFTGDGRLDPSFGRGGKVVTGLETDAGSLAIQRDGKLVAAGFSRGQGKLSFALTRYTTRGTLDASFGEGGTVVSSFGIDHASAAEDVAIQRDGRIVAFGSSGDEPSGPVDFALARYNTRGHLDTSFGRAGKVLTAFVGDEAEAAAVTIQAEGKVVAVGYVTYPSIRFALARYTNRGRLDPSFGRHGKVLTGFGIDRAGLAEDVAIQVDGKPVVAGASAGFALTRYNGDGKLDPSFGVGGKALTNFGATGDSDSSGAARAVVTENGRIVVAGSSGDDRCSHFALARYTGEGSLDPSFGEGGKVETHWLCNAAAEAAAIQADGKIVAGGRAGHRFALARYTSDGILDTSFGSGGKVLTDFGSG
jgi:uncharacterized delta-60 repeat protein